MIAYFETPLINVQIDPKKQIKPQALIPLRGSSAEKAKEEQKYFKEAFGLD